MSDERNSHIERDTRRTNAKVMHICLHIAFFFAVAVLLSLFIFDDFLMTQAAKSEHATWLTAEMQLKLKFAFRCLSELFLILSLSSLSVSLFFMASNSIPQLIKRIKNKSAKVSN